MTSNLPVVQVNKPDMEPDFEAIEAAVMETARGRWFLSEYARRMRAAETTKVLEAITRIERSITTDKSKDAAGGSRGELADAVTVIERRLSEIAWSLRERGFDGRTCAEIENQARALRQLTGLPPPPVTASVAVPASPPVPVVPVVAAPVAAAPVARPATGIPRPPLAASLTRSMPSVAMLNTQAAQIRESHGERAGTNDATTFVGRTLRSLAEIDAMDDRARARLFR
ncbi:hypothetical protein [Methylocella sp. CPCC 101449]|uniref:hypothetical protein n=1 Tax=Methylocella sp. CPCC 101449 TaxID=2987531 RepID=UPI00288D8E41|nr:hypothetical protein [Methylocella sp. CPCC 101449]MDT2021043.1 hypothetical protein [Methylocella sp. CPCC 101449]